MIERVLFDADCFVCALLSLPPALLLQYGNFAWVNGLSWSGSSAFHRAANRTWIAPDGAVAGFSKAAEGLTFVKVDQAGHMVSPGAGRKGDRGGGSHVDRRGIGGRECAPDPLLFVVSLTLPLSLLVLAPMQVPMDQPAWALDLFERFIKDEKFYDE